MKSKDMREKSIEELKSSVVDYKKQQNEIVRPSYSKVLDSKL